MIFYSISTMFFEVNLWFKNDFYEISFAFPWGFFCISIIFLRNVHDIPIGCLCFFYGITMGFEQVLDGISMMFQ